MQVKAADAKEAATSKALQLISDAPRDQARALAKMVLNSLDTNDQSRFAERLVNLNLALGNNSDAASAAVMSALADQRQGEYKVRSILQQLDLSGVSASL